MIGCTTVAANYLGYADVLADSWGREHPGAPFVVLVLDTNLRADRRRFDVVTPDDLIANANELDVLKAIYGPLELATALKPHLLRHLLRRGDGPAVFLDPDTEIYAPLDDVGSAALAHGVALSPHVLHPIPDDGRSPSEHWIQSTGVFNTGLIGVGPSAAAFLDWWSIRLRRDCILDPKAGRFVDQRCVDWVPSLFDNVVLRDPGLNVAFWNLHERPLTESAGVVRAGAAPLRHFHFSGFDPEHPETLTAYETVYGRPMRVRLSDDEVLRRLCAAYATRLLDAGFAEARTRPYGLSRTAAGVAITGWDRYVYRAAVLSAESRAGPLPPSPFKAETAEAFLALVRDPARQDALTARARARLAVLRAQGYGRSRKPPPGRASRFAWSIGSRVRARATRRRAVDAALVAFLSEVEDRAGGAAEPPDDLTLRMQQAPDGPFA